MTTGSIITMIIVLGGVWGGFAWLLRAAIRAEETRTPDAGGENTTG